MSPIHARDLLKLKRAVRKYHNAFGRHNLPWRKPQTSYRVFVSEMMLQQTQVERVIQKFNAFVSRFKNFKELGEANLTEVYVLWQGLGYNRRAKYLRDSAKIITKVHRGILPKTTGELQKLPGVGPYTAGALCAFSYGNPEPFVETNIRTAVMHHMFPNKKKVSDAEILSLLEQLRPKSGREAKDWYAGLMDYGAHLKRTGIRTNKRSTHYVQQKAFKGSLREVRGALIRTISSKPQTERQLQTLKFKKAHIREALTALSKDTLIEKSRGVWKLVA